MLEPAALSSVSTLVLAAIDVAVRVKVTIYVNVNVTSTPIGIAPRISPRRAHGDARAERKHRCGDISRRIIVVRRVGRIQPGAVHNSLVITRHADHFRSSPLDLGGLL